MAGAGDGDGPPVTMPMPKLGRRESSLKKLPRRGTSDGGQAVYFVLVLLGPDCAVAGICKVREGRGPSYVRRFVHLPLHVRLNCGPLS